MKILYVPYLIVPALGAEDRRRILEAAGPGAALAVATFVENLRRLRAGQPLLAVIDKRKGY